MALRLLDYPLTSQNNRVGDQGGLKSELNRATFPSREDRDFQIEQAYRQIFFHAMKCDRDVNLESQFRDGSITTRDFIRGLLLSRRFILLGSFPRNLYFPDCYLRQGAHPAWQVVRNLDEMGGELGF